MSDAKSAVGPTLNLLSTVSGHLAKAELQSDMH